MSKKDLLEEVVQTLEDSSFNYSYPYTSSFDIFASNKDNSLILKILDNIDSLDRTFSKEIKKLSDFLNASPLLIGDHSTENPLKEEIVYKRHELPVVNTETFDKILKKEDLFLMHGKGGYYVKINPEKLRERRKDEGISINRLSKKTGISSRSLLNYEKNGIASLEKAKELERILGDIIGEIDLFKRKFEVKIEKRVEGEVTKILKSIGLNSLETEKSPFDICAKDESKTYLISKKDNEPDQKLIRLLESLEETIPSYPFFVSEKKDYFGDLPAFRKKELRKFKDKNDLRENVCA